MTSDVLNVGIYYMEFHQSGVQSAALTDNTENTVGSLVSDVVSAGSSAVSAKSPVTTTGALVVGDHERGGWGTA